MTTNPIRGSRRLGYLGTAVTVALWAMASGSVRPAAAADYIGAEACAECHEEYKVSFAETAHGRADLPDRGQGTGCEACHGAGQDHAGAKGDKSLIVNFRDGDPAAANQRCLNCHTGGAVKQWRTSAHDSADLSCVSCHQVHSPWSNLKALKKRAEMPWGTEQQNFKMAVTESCLSCHPAGRAGLNQRSHHPLANGQMGCSDCHNPHGSNLEGAIDAKTLNDKCYECHAETRGPFLWEHAPAREDCTNCHSPHGSNEPALLTFSPPRLCQSCHLVGHHQTEPGSADKPWVINRSCTNCHARIHGSNHPSGILFMR